VNNLAGKLVASPVPDRPGFWAYRQLDDGALLETELTQAEWQTLHGAAMAETNRRIDELNTTHPLNVAALELIRRTTERPGNPGAMHWLHVLSLASLGLVDDNGGQDEEAWEQFASWTSGEEAMTKALHRLESADIDPDHLLSLPPVEAARLILDELGIG